MEEECTQREIYYRLSRCNIVGIKGKLRDYDFDKRREQYKVYLLRYLIVDSFVLSLPSQVFTGNDCVGGRGGRRFERRNRHRKR